LVLPDPLGALLTERDVAKFGVDEDASLLVVLDLQPEVVGEALLVMAE
jgi:hypothetical protein